MQKITDGLLPRLPLLTIIITLLALSLSAGAALAQDQQDEAPPVEAAEQLANEQDAEPSADEPAQEAADVDAADPEQVLQPWDDRLRQNVDSAFAKVNKALEPILFFDASFGAFDRSLEELREQEAAAEQKVAAARQRVAELEPADAELDAAAAYDLGRAKRALRIARLELNRVRETVAKKEAAQAKGETSRSTTLPLIVAMLALGGLFFTLRLGFVNVRLLGHSIQVIRGKYDNPDDHGEINHFQALTSALSATVGLGNIAGVAIAISFGGPGTVFWMWVVAFFGMSSKFCSCTLAQIYRNITPESGKSEHVLGGPMLYLTEGVKQQLGGGSFAAGFGRTLAILFAVFTIFGSLGGGNMFQGNQTFAIVADVMFVQEIPNEAELEEAAADGDTAAAEQLQQARAEAADEKQKNKESFAWVGGLILAGLVGVVIIGGIKRIGEVTSKLVPAMCVFYCGVCLVIVIANIQAVPTVLGEIVTAAFTFEAMAWGGVISVFVFGVTRGVFSNEAGLGSAAIAHSAAKTNEPVREGVVAMIGPFIDTIIVCTMTSLAILITDAHLDEAGGFTNAGIAITANAFESLAPWLRYLLTLAVFVFAYSTMISWSYYGERACEYLFGVKGILPYRIIFLFFVFLGPMMTLEQVLGFTDLMMLSMAYPNIVGVVILTPVVAKATKSYIRRLRSGEMKPYDRDAIEGEPSI